MRFRYAVEETLEDGSTLLWPIPPRFGKPVPDYITFSRVDTWLTATAYALELMRRSGWEMEIRAVCTSIWEEDC